MCQTCQTTETMEHILVECHESAVNIIWMLAQGLWPYDLPPWPAISLGTILGCRSLSPPQEPIQNNENPNQRKMHLGATQLLQILVSESPYLIWTLRCKHVIQEKTHFRLEIEKKWTQAINWRLTEDKIIATTVEHDIAHIRKVKNTWEMVLGKTEKLPDGWIYLREVLVGTRKRVWALKTLTLSPTLPLTGGVHKLAFSLSPGFAWLQHARGSWWQVSLI